MGRYLTDLADVLRRAGLEVVELDGWQTRARGSGGYADGCPDTVMVHHTASPPSASGESDANYCTFGDEDAPLANVCLDRDGIWWVCAAGATNTNGKGGPLAGVPADSMNTHAIGVEANGGYGHDWPQVQCDSYLVGVRQLKTAYGCPNVFAHFEWAPDRKIDPAGPSPWATGNTSWNMDAFRADLAGGGSEEDMALTDDDIRKIAAAVWDHAVMDGKAAGWRLNMIQGTVRQYLGGWTEDTPPPDQALLKQIAADVDKLLKQ
jgi:hypothetical protein